MNMFRKVLPYFLLIPLIVSCGGRDNPKEIFEKDLTVYLDYYNKTDWEKLTGMIYPRFFIAVRKSQVIETLKMLDSVGMKRTFQLKGIEKITPILSDGEESFCRIFYNTGITVVINKVQLPQLEKFIEDFTEDFGKENVKFDEKEFIFTINAHQSVIAVSGKDKNKWSYMELNNEHSFDIVAQAVPKNIMKELIK